MADLPVSFLLIRGRRILRVVLVRWAFLQEISDGRGC